MGETLTRVIDPRIDPGEPLSIAVRTTDGEKVKLMVGRGGQLLSGLIGGPTHKEGADALCVWL